MVGLRTAVYSTWNAAKDPKRLRIHIAVDQQEASVFREAFGFRPTQTKRALPGGSSLELRWLDVKDFSTLHNATRIEGSTGAVRTDGPSNYVRFFIDSYLPADSTRAVWLDADVLVQRDVVNLADSLLEHPSKTIAFARYPG